MGKIGRRIASVEKNIYATCSVPAQNGMEEMIIRDG